MELETVTKGQQYNPKVATKTAQKPLSFSELGEFRALGPSAVIQHVRHIAVQGFSPRMAVAAMVDALDLLIPTRTKIFFWVGEDSAPVDFYERDPLMSALDTYFSQSAAMAADPDEPSFDKLANSPVEFGGWKRFERFANWDRSIMKNEVFGAYRIGNNLDFTIRDSGQPIGVLAIAREPGSTPYLRRDIETILSLRGHFVHAMNAPKALERAETIRDGNVVTALIAPDGTVVSASEAAQLMLHQLRPAQESLRLHGLPAPAPVRKSVELLLAGSEGGLCAPPHQDVRTSWGRFRIIAHSLAPDGTCLVSIERFLPKELVWIRRAAGMDLSPRERELAVAMCGPNSSDRLAVQFGLTSGSFREYSRRIYRRLGVDGRTGVRDLIENTAS